MTVRITRRAALGGSLLAASALAVPGARAQAAKTIRIGILTDLNGPNAASNGHGSVVGTTLAAEDFMQLHPDIKVEVMVADYQSKPDIAASIARDWIDRQGVDIISQVNNSAAALAICSLVQEKDKVALLTGPASSAITGKFCTPNHVHWTYDTWALGKSTGGAVVAAGGNSWFFIGADYTFGHQLAGDTAGFVTRAGGKVLGTVYTPFPETTDFSALLLQAAASGCKVIGLANSGIDTVNCVKQAHEFGITRKAKLAALLMMLPDLHGVGLATAQGLLLSEAFYWDLNEATRAYGKRFGARMSGWMPSMIQAGDYCGELALPEGDGGARHRPGQGQRAGDGGADEGDADRRHAVRQGQRAPGRPRSCTRCTCSRSSRRRKANTPGTTTSWSRRRQPSRHSGR